MGLIKKIDVKEHFAARRASRRTAAQLASEPDATGFSGAEAAETRLNVRDFAEDFVKEHSSSSAPAVPPSRPA